MLCLQKNLKNFKINNICVRMKKTEREKNTMNPKLKYYENTAKTVIDNLKKRRMQGYYCETKEDAVNKVLEIIEKGKSVGWGGSMTLNETGIMEAVRNSNYEIIDRDAAKTKEEQKEIFGKICGCDYFLMSSNAITLDGELVNVDGRGNRVSFLCFGPENVIIVAGVNKIVPDIESAIKRVRNIAAPPNAVRLNKNTPCFVTGKCADCFSLDCICAQTVITRLSAVPNRIKVILVGEELGY